MAFRLLCLFLLFYKVAFSQNDNTEAKGNINIELATKKEQKSGFSFIGLPAFSYNSDIGSQYGAFGTLYFYGKGERSIYPSYKHALSFDYSASSNGASLYQLYYEGNQLFGLPIKVSLNNTYQYNPDYTFYGFNGREAIYRPEYLDPSSPDYISRNYYKLGRNLLNISANAQGAIGGLGVNWFLGFDLYRFIVGSVDKVNHQTLYDDYVSRGIISGSEASGGNVNVIKLGAVYDTRNQESNPSNGAWTDLLIITTPRLIGNSTIGFTKISFTYRQYYTLIPQSLSLATRVASQWTFGARQAPSYMEPILFSTFSDEIIEGLGGYKTLRGIFPNRIVGSGVAYANISLRWKFLQFRLLNQNIYCATNTFTDWGTVTEKYRIDYESAGFREQKDIFHGSIGCGINIAMNENFVLYFNIAKSLHTQDAATIGAFLSTSWLF